MSAIYTNDPATGESVTLSELARRHGLTAGCLSRRYHQGLRDWKLVEQIDREALARAKAADYRARAERQQQLANVNTAALMQPFKHIAQARKMVGMRMLQPHELAMAQGFPDHYQFAEIDGKPLAKHKQVRLIGNSVCPPLARAIVEANFTHEQRFMPLSEVA